MSEKFKNDYLKNVPPKPTRKYKELQDITSPSELKNNEEFENLKNDDEDEIINQNKEFNDHNVADKLTTEEPNANVDVRSNLEVNDEIKNDGDELKQHYQRSVSTPEERISPVLNLPERPKTYNNSGNRTDTSKLRLRRKESFLQTVANVFKRKIDIRSNTDMKHTIVNVSKPPLVSGHKESFKGVLFELIGGEFRLRWCLLRGDFLLICSDEEYKNAEHCLSWESVISVQLIDEEKYDSKIDDFNLYCFEIKTSTNTYVYGNQTPEHRTKWLNNIAECLNDNLNNPEFCYQRIGWSYIKEGITGDWQGAWLLLSNRKLFYKTNDDMIRELDLRKARLIDLQKIMDGDCIPQVLEEGPSMLIDCQKTCFYFRSWISSDTQMWYNAVKVCNVNGSRLEEQQLYSYGIPVIVEKCINFIYLHGSMLVGIYRRTGNSCKSEEIVEMFKSNAWVAQLPSDVYTGYDVARAFKKFFYRLSEPIIIRSSQEELHQASHIRDEEERVKTYQIIFEKYPEIYYNTLRMLLRHLQFIVEYKEKNLMTSENVASVWCVTMMHSEVHDDAHFIAKDCVLVTDLINLSNKLFPESEKERLHELLVRKTWEDYVTKIKRPINGNFRIWIYYCDKEGECYNVELGLQRTAQDICKELSEKIDLSANKLILEERILNDNLIRPIHYDEKVLDVVLKWAYWDDDDRKDNCLIISPLEKYEMYLVDHMISPMVEIKFADSKVKNFQTLVFELNCGKLNYYKDTAKTQMIKTWNIDDVQWYIGNERNRNPPSKHTITFIEKESAKRTEAIPWFGNILSFNSEFAKNSWVSALWKEGHKKEFLPLAMEFLMKRCQENHK